MLCIVAYIVEYIAYIIWAQNACAHIFDKCTRIMYCAVLSTVAYLYKFSVYTMYHKLLSRHGHSDPAKYSMVVENMLNVGLSK